MADDSGIPWKTILGLGATVGGTYLANRATSKQNQVLDNRTAMLDKLAQADMTRRNNLSDTVMPSLLQALGYKHPASLMGSGGGGPFTQAALAGGDGSSTTPMYQPAGSQFSRAGAIGAGGGALAGAALGGPLGAAAGAAVGGLAGLVGRGRRAANGFVGSVEDPVGADLAEVVRLKDSGDMAGATAKFKQVYQGYKAATNQAIGMGGKQALVAQQSLQNPKLQGTINTIAQQLGVSLGA